MKTVRNLIFLGFKITADGDCSHEIKRLLLLGRKAITNIDSILKSRDITLLTGFLDRSVGKKLPAMQETLVQFLGWEDPLEKDRLPTPVFLGFPGGSAGKESACNVGDLGSIPGLGRSPGEGKSYPLPYSGLENSMSCIVHGVTKSRT